MRCRGFLLLLLPLVAALPAACGGADGEEAPPGRAAPPRIAALSPAIAVIVRDLGLEERVVARHDYDLIGINDAPPVGHQDNIDYEALLRSDPTHVLTQWGDRDLPPRLVDMAGRRGWRLQDFTLLSLDDVVAEADEIAQLFEPFIDPARADPPYAVRFGAVLGGEAPALGALGPVLLLGATDPPAAIGPGSVHYEILTRLGATPAITEGAAWQELDAEDVLRLDPAAIILIDPRRYDPSAEPATRASAFLTGSGAGGAAPARSPFASPDLLGRVGALPIRAVRHGRIILIDHPLALLPSVTLLEVTRELRAALDLMAARDPD